MKSQFLEAGQIVNTHGIQGELKVQPWGDSPDFLMDFEMVYIDEKPVKFLTRRVHKGNLLVTLAGIESINDAMRMKGKIVSIDRTGIVLPEGRHFLADLIGLEVRDAATDAVLGKLTDVLTPPSSQIYVIEGAHSYLVPAVDEFIAETNVEGGYIRIKLVEGLQTDV